MFKVFNLDFSQKKTLSIEIGEGELLSKKPLNWDWRGRIVIKNE